MDRKKELQKTMTDKQRIFCHQYVLDWNGARAARKAGYKESGAREAASTLLTKPNVREYIELVKDDIAEVLGITKAGMLEKIVKIAKANIADVYKGWMTLADYEKLKTENPDVMEAIQEISTKTETVKGFIEDDKELVWVKIKMYDSPSATRDVFKALGWNEAEKHVVTNVMDVSGLSTDELLKRAAAIDKINKK